MAFHLPNQTYAQQNCFAYIAGTGWPMKRHFYIVPKNKRYINDFINIA